MSLGMKRKFSGATRFAKRRRVGLRKRRGGRRRRATARRSRVDVRISRNPVPDKLFTVLRFSQTDTLAISSTDPPGYKAWRTSLNDPDWGGFGAQPLWFDQLAAMYSRYRVHGLKYRITMQLIDTASTRMAQVVIRHTPYSTAEVAWSPIGERRGSRTVILKPVTSGVQTIKGYMATGKPWGLTKREMKEDEDFISDVSTNPTKSSYLYMYGRTQATTAVIDFRIDVEMFTEFMERKQIGGS